MFGSLRQPRASSPACSSTHPTAPFAVKARRSHRSHLSQIVEGLQHKAALGPGPCSMAAAALSVMLCISDAIKEALCSAASRMKSVTCGASDRNEPGFCRNLRPFWLRAGEHGPTSDTASVFGHLEGDPPEEGGLPKPGSPTITRTTMPERFLEHHRLTMPVSWRKNETH